MTEPVARAASPRRTVRMAAALVAGQAALCAVIGWVTFGSGGESAPPAASGQVGRMAAPPVAVPSISLPVPGPSAVPNTSAATSPARRFTGLPKPPPKPPKPPAPVRTQTAAAPPPTTPATTPASSAPVTPPPPSPELAAPSPVASSDVQPDVVVGEPCDPPGAPGLTEDGVKVHCVQGPDGPPSWQIN